MLKKQGQNGPCKRLTEAEVTALTILSNLFIQLWLTRTFRLFFKFNWA